MPTTKSAPPTVNRLVDQRVEQMSYEELRLEQLRREFRGVKPPINWFAVLQPYLILLATALVSGYLLPSITRRWQDRQKEFETKTRLVGEIGRHVSQFITAIQFYERGAEEQIPGGYNPAYYEWEVQSSRIGSELSSYYRGQTIPTDWARFAETVNELYALSGTVGEAPRGRLLARIKTGVDGDAIHWESLLNGDREARETQAYRQAWFDLRSAILRRKDRLVQDVLEKRITGFSE